MNDAVIAVGSNISVTNISNGSSYITNYEFSGVFNMINAEFTVASDKIKDPDVMIKNSNLTDCFNIRITPSNLSDATFILPCKGVSGEYNVTIIYTLFVDIGADMIEATAMPTEGTNMQSNYACFIYNQLKFLNKEIVCLFFALPILKISFAC